jgi:hypothetical protein
MKQKELFGENTTYFFLNNLVDLIFSLRVILKTSPRSVSGKQFLKGKKNLLRSFQFLSCCPSRRTTFKKKIKSMKRITTQKIQTRPHIDVKSKDSTFY